MSDEKKVNLDESLSWAGKLVFAGIASYLGHSAYKGIKAAAAPPSIPIKIRGNPQQMRAFVDAIVSSRAFQQEISKPGASIEGVFAKLKIKNMNRSQFERLTGRRWPL
jgi:hypothetical protein